MIAHGRLLTRFSIAKMEESLWKRPTTRSGIAAEAPLYSHGGLCHGGGNNHIGTHIATGAILRYLPILLYKRASDDVRW